MGSIKHMQGTSIYLLGLDYYYQIWQGLPKFNERSEAIAASAHRGKFITIDMVRELHDQQMCIQNVGHKCTGKCHRNNNK